MELTIDVLTMNGVFLVLTNEIRKWIEQKEKWLGQKETKWFRQILFVNNLISINQSNIDQKIHVLVPIISLMFDVVFILQSMIKHYSINQHQIQRHSNTFFNPKV